jgi:serine/threonine protein kinase
MTATLEPSFAKAATPFPQTGASISYNGRNNAQHCLEQEIDPAKHSFRTNKVLGHGASAWVEEVVDEVEGHIMAMKVFPAHRRDRERVKITSNYHSVEFQHAFTDPRGFCILVTPVADYDLATFYEHCTTKGYVESIVQPVRKWFSCLAHGLEFIHSHRIRHKGTKLDPHRRSCSTQLQI